MLSERQKERIASKLNDEADLPLVSEGREGEIIRDVVNRVEGVLEPALKVFMSEDHVGCIRVALDETMSVDDRTLHISDVMRREKSEPLARNLDERVDSFFIPDQLEATFSQKIADKLIDEFVEWTVGKVDAKLEGEGMPLSREAPTEDLSLSTETPPESMLNERQRHVAITRLNEEIDVPLVSEGREEEMVEKMFDRVMPHVEPSLSKILPEVWLNCIKLVLNEELDVKDKTDQISEMVRGEYSEPLSRELNERIDVSLIPEGIEGKMLKILSNKVLDEIVEWTVGEFDEKFE